jgi:hypothetical protein
MDLNELSAKKVEIFLVFMVGMLQVMQGAWSLYLNGQTAERIEEAKRVQDISDKILEAEPIIAGDNPSRAKVALGALYVRAVTDADKEDIVRIAVLSDKKDLRDAVSYIIRNDNQATESLLKSLDGLLKPIAIQQVDSGMAQVQTPQSNTKVMLDQSKQDAPIEPTPEVKASATLSDKLHGKANPLTGWIYLGTTKSGKTSFNNPTTSSMELPSNGSKVTTITFVALREKGTTLEGTVQAILPPNKEVTVLGISPRKLSNGDSAIWARISAK